MENFQFWLTLGTATIPALLTGLASFSASWMKNRSDIKSLEKQFSHDSEMVNLNHKHEIDNLQKKFEQDFEQMEKRHQHDIERMKEAHKLELENIQKKSEVDLTSTVAQGLMAMLTPAMTPAITKYLENNDIFNQPEK
ncbi:hypothetical protein [Streptococcus jiangjianxini]|uniref:hypothetical protein n=1 Tax=Streptococcus jiangjianxini TaxID=3161189 RepID=UPI0032EFDC60